MVKINEDPHEQGYQLQPKYRLSAIFETCDDLVEIVQSLEQAGFTEKQLEVFAGPEGAAKLDFAGNNHGFLARLKRSLEMIYADETDLLRKIDMTLQRGGLAIFVNTAGDESLKDRAFEVIKDHNPSEVCYWGKLAVERLSVRESPLPVPAHAVTPP